MAVSVPKGLVPNARQVRLIMAALAVTGVLLRFVWIVVGDHLGPGLGENYQIAQAIARTGVIADAYHFGSGATAHAAPLVPLFAGAVYLLFGLHSTASEIVLTIASLGFVILSVVWLNRAFTILGSPLIARIAAIAFIALVPLNFEYEAAASRVREQSIGAAGLALYLWLVLRLDTRREQLDWRSIVGLAALASPLVLICPPVALGAYGCLGLLALRRRGLWAVVVAATLSVGIFVVTAYPWALRNERLFGEKIWVRSNFGFVFAEGFHAAAVDPVDPRQTFLDRQNEVDPYQLFAGGYPSMIAHGGEAGYNHYWVGQTTAWIKANPAAATRIAVRHFGEFFFPPRWQWRVYSARGTAVPLKQALDWAVTLLGFAGIAAGIVRDRRYLYTLVILLLPVLPYLASQPGIDYRYVIASLLAFLAADFVMRFITARIGTAEQAPLTA